MVNIFFSSSKVFIQNKLINIIKKGVVITMSKLVDKERLAKLAQALDTRMKNKVAEEEARALAAEAAVDAKAEQNKADIAAINNAETGLLKQAKDYADEKIEEVNGAAAELEGRVDALEAKDSQHDASIKANADAIAQEILDREAAVKEVADDLAAEILRAEAAEKANADNIAQEILDRKAADEVIQNALDEEIARAKAAEKVNADAITKLNGDATVEGSVDKKIADAIAEVNGEADALEARVAAVEAKNTEQDAAISAGDAKALEDAKAYADQQITALVNGAPDAMNTLQELAKAITDHQDVYDSYVNTVSAELAKKVDKVEGSRLITETEAAAYAAKAEVSDVEEALQDAKDYTDAAKTALNGDISNAVNRIAALETAVNDEESGLNKAVADIEADLVEKQEAIEAAQNQADKGVADAAAAKAQADKGVADAAAAKAAADTADDKAEAAQADIDALEAIVGNAEAGLVKDVADNTAAIEQEALDRAAGDAQALADAKSYVDNKVTEINGAAAELGERVDALEAKDTVHETRMGEIEADLEAEINRAKAAEKVNADAIAQEVLDRDAAIEAALEPYSTTEEVKQILTNVVGSLDLSMVDNQVVLKLGGVEGVTLSQVTLDLATDDDIDAIIAGLDA